MAFFSAILNGVNSLISGPQMTDIRRVLLCGKSLFISGLQATLENAPGLDLQVVDSQPDRIRERISEWQPDILILENELLYCQASLSLLIDFPLLKLIGLDIESNRMLVFSGRSASAPTTIDLLQVIGVQGSQHEDLR